MSGPFIDPWRSSSSPGNVLEQRTPRDRDEASRSKKVDAKGAPAPVEVSALALEEPPHVLGEEPPELGRVESYDQSQGRRQTRKRNVVQERDSESPADESARRASRPRRSASASSAERPSRGMR